MQHRRKLQLFSYSWTVSKLGLCWRQSALLFRSKLSLVSFTAWQCHEARTAYIRYQDPLPAHALSLAQVFIPFLQAHCLWPTTFTPPAQPTEQAGVLLTMNCWTDLSSGNVNLYFLESLIMQGTSTYRVSKSICFRTPFFSKRAENQVSQG